MTRKAGTIFFDSYGGLLYRTAVKAGLSDAEAQDVRARHFHHRRGEENR